MAATGCDGRRRRAAGDFGRRRRQRPQCGGAARQACGGEERSDAQGGVAQGAGPGEGGVAFPAVGDVATSAAWAGGQAWLPMPRKRAAAVNSQTWPAGAASSSATPRTRTSIDAATTVLRAPRSSHRPTAGMHTRPVTMPTVMAVPVTGADGLSTVMP
nr:hypothetical protein GCM10020063_032030 [Dactylosporangium thailandense]